jgi:hypothetical protein
MSRNELPFDSNARKLLVRRILEGSPDKSVDYAPDSRYDAEKRCAVVGPLTVQIHEILARHSRLWALEQRTRVNPAEHEGKAQWLVQMRQADAEIKRFVSGHRLTTGHAA